MGLFDFLKKKKSPEKDDAPKPTKPKSNKKQRTPTDVVQAAFSSQGVETNAEEVTEMLKQVKNMLDLKPVLPEQLAYSNSAELQAEGSKYVVQFSLILMAGSSQLPQKALGKLMSCATYWACASEIAKKKELDEFVLQEGQKIAVCDYDFGDHPIYALFPNLLKKSVIGRSYRDR